MFRLFAVLILLVFSSPAFAEQLSVELECKVSGDVMAKDWRDKYVSLEAINDDVIGISIKENQLIPENNNKPIGLTVTTKSIKLPRGVVYEFDNLKITELEIDRYTGAIRLRANSKEIYDSFLIIDGKCKKTVEKKRLF